MHFYKMSFRCKQQPFVVFNTPISSCISLFVNFENFFAKINDSVTGIFDFVLTMCLCLRTYICVGQQLLFSITNESLYDFIIGFTTCAYVCPIVLYVAVKM